MEGELIKLSLCAYTDGTFADDKIDPDLDIFYSLINPEEIVMNHRIDYDDLTPTGNSGSKRTLKTVTSPKLELKFLFDSTGIIPMANSGRSLLGQSLPASFSPQGVTVPVQEQIDHFKAVTHDFSGDIHSPRFVKVSYKDLIFKGQLDSLKITYTLFDPSGTPMRAVAQASFTEYIDQVTLDKLANRKSPDLTHVRVIKNGDTLPLMCNKIYGNSKYYLEVAKVNNLSDFRNLIPGTKLFFPPLDKTTA